MEISALYQLFLNSSGVTTDTRKIGKNSIFFALKGNNFNGNNFALEALALGASYAVVDEAQEHHEKLILVNDVLSTLQELANYHRKQLNTTVIGITGSNGKTTSKELIHAVLSSHFKTKATVGNLNNHIGVPLTLLSIEYDDVFSIIEMGANHLGEIAELCKIADPDYGLLTNVGRAHLEGFGTFENIISTKFGLYDHIKSKQGVCFANADNEILKSYKHHKVVNYGLETVNFCSGHITKALPFLEVSVLLPENETILIQTKLVGQYNLENILAACCIGAYFGVPSEKIKTALTEYTPSNNRSEFRKTANNSLILDAYNANPSSMEKALENFSQHDEKNKLAILGDMFEMGSYANETHKELIEKSIALKLDCIFVGEHFYNNKTNDNNFFKTVDDLIINLEANKISNKLILLKGSRGIKLEQLVPLL